MKQKPTKNLTYMEVAFQATTLRLHNAKTELIISNARHRNPQDTVYFQWVTVAKISKSSGFPHHSTHASILHCGELPHFWNQCW